MLKIVRLLLLPLGLLNKLVELSKNGARDMHNKLRFKGVIIEKDCCINPNSQIAQHVHIMENCLINNSKILSYSYLGANSRVQNTTIGRFCSIANNVSIGLGSHPLNLFSTSPLFYRIDNPLNIKILYKDLGIVEYKPIEIGHDVWIGANAIILDGVKIGHGAVIAANAVVTKDIPPYAIVGGVPAKIIKYRFTEDRVTKLVALNWWDWSLEKIIKEMPN